jgi:phosphohistidine phosphatase
MHLMLLRHAFPKRLSPACAISIVRLMRGRNDAAKIGAYMAHHALCPDRVIVSPARRARETWERVSKAFSALPPVDYDDRLYEGDPDATLAVIRETDSAIRSLLIVGHNPGLHETARLLIAAGDVETASGSMRGCRLPASRSSISPSTTGPRFVPITDGSRSSSARARSRCELSVGCP